ncbi:MAG: DUF2207 domain-containing protein [Sulfurimonas sp.]
MRWNIIGTGWSIPLYNIEANFFLPASLQRDDIALSTYTGSYGSRTSSATTEWMDSTHLRVNIPSLQSYQGATVELAYPENILDQNGLENLELSLLEWFLRYWHWGALAGFLLYFKNIYERYRGFVDRRAVAVRYYPPKEMSVLEAGLVLDKFADNKDFSAALLELAHEGYLEIFQSQKSIDPLLKRTGKDTKGLSSDLKYLLEHVVFKGGAKSYILGKKPSESKAKALRSGFGQINDNLYTWVVADGYMLENPQRIRKNFLIKSLLLLIPVIVLAVYTLIPKFGPEIIFAMIFPLVFGAAGVAIASKKGITNKIFGVIFVVGGAAPAIGILQSGMNLKELLFSPFGVIVMIGIAFWYTYKKIGRFTQKGAYTKNIF